MNIVLAGSVAYDYLMKFPGKFSDNIMPDKIETISLSFLVESMVRQRGGVAPNIAYSMALVGGQARLFATAGEDFEEYRIWLESKGIDTTWVKVIEGVNTGSFFATTDIVNNQIASFYPGAMGRSADISFHDMGTDKPDLVVVSPTSPDGMDKYVAECKELGIPYIYDPSQQLARISADEIRRGIEGAKALFVNEYEYSLVENHTGMKLADILAQVEFLVVTLGEKGTRIHQADGSTIDVPVVPPKNIADPTGVGDAFRGGFLTGYSRGWDFELSGKMGALCATYCLEVDGTQSQEYTRAEYITRFRQHFDDGGLLDELLK